MKIFEKVWNMNRWAELNYTPVIPPNCERHHFKKYPLSYIQPYLNLKILLGKHLGLKGNVEERLKEGDSQALEVYQIVGQTLEQAKGKSWIKLQGIYQFFPAQAEGNDVLIYDPKDRSSVLERFNFPRQSRDPYLCLSDFLTPVESGVMDYVGLFAVTAGQGVREKAAELKERGDYLASYVLQALALECAEGFAERIHQIMRDAWGIPDSIDLTMKERLAARYQGMRFSLGYPACPNIEDQTKIFRLIHPEEIGIDLTEGFMMDPEASVTALVFAHPKARYFSVI
jgi:5-methyltetrahydrofolate--homocysteine methyltransferase